IDQRLAGVIVLRGRIVAETVGQEFYVSHVDIFCANCNVTQGSSAMIGNWQEIAYFSAVRARCCRMPA
ncbi:MAG TPA: hypothetical protein VLA28_05835, partial [Afifellaceae bacterium]|nr:hypothetical protein [Afifellaceae bacterium]